MNLLRSNIDPRSNINRRQLNIDSEKPEQRKYERRISGERRGCWVRSSEWSSFDLQLRNRYFWSILKM